MQQHQGSNCVLCGKKFNSSKNLKKHGKVHEIKRIENAEFVMAMDNLPDIDNATLALL